MVFSKRFNRKAGVNHPEEKLVIRDKDKYQKNNKNDYIFRNCYFKKVL